MLLAVASSVELELDFAEEGLAAVPSEKIRTDVTRVKEEIERMIASYRHGRVYREGVKVVIVGDPNVGKSSILNSLLDKDRSIVTHLPGTTRDVIEENITINGMLFRLVDTAGLRDSIDLVESEGIRRTFGEIEGADIVLRVRDCTEPSAAAQFEGKTVVDVLNKFDLLDFDHTRIANIGQGVLISAKTGYGIDLLKEKIFEQCHKPSEDVTLSNLRHKHCLEKANESLQKVLESLERGMSGEFLVLDLRGAMHSLEMIIGVVTTDEILNNIFDKFCIGK
jgi:tRNA modification GTPase